ncbi:MAG: hypothetical protein NZ853_08420 [Leptospiraceae bacterium]|nr:hypothetical protein [Leptospiraceae bacterium]MDW7976800.1 hypothetical protein [Leptospiraceae bacterium]
METIKIQNCFKKIYESKGYEKSCEERIIEYIQHLLETKKVSKNSRKIAEYVFWLIYNEFVYNGRDENGKIRKRKFKNKIKQQFHSFLENELILSDEDFEKLMIDIIEIYLPCLKIAENDREKLKLYKNCIDRDFHREKRKNISIGELIEKVRLSNPKAYYDYDWKDNLRYLKLLSKIQKLLDEIEFILLKNGFKNKTHIKVILKNFEVQFYNPHLENKEEIYSKVADELNMNKSTVKSVIHRFEKKNKIIKEIKEAIE